MNYFIYVNIYWCILVKLMDNKSIVDIIPYPLKDIYVIVKTTNDKYITYTDCFECSMLSIIHLLILDLNGYENIDVNFLKTKTTNKKLIEFFEKYQSWHNDISENTEMRNKWSTILNEIDGIYYHRDSDGNLTNDYSKKHYEIDTIVENVINIFSHIFDLVDWKKYELLIPVKRFIDSKHYQMCFDIITKNFEREGYVVTIKINNLYMKRKNDIKSYCNNKDIIFVVSMIKVNNDNIWGWVLHSCYNIGEDNLIDGHSEIYK